MGEHRQKERADELTVGEPDGLVWAHALNGENVNKDGLGAPE